MRAVILLVAAVLVAILVPAPALARGFQASYEANRPAVVGPDVSERAFAALTSRGLAAALLEDARVLLASGVPLGRLPKVLAADLAGGGLAILGFPSAGAAILAASGGYEDTPGGKPGDLMGIGDALDAATCKSQGCEWSRGGCVCK